MRKFFGYLTDFLRRVAFIVLLVLLVIVVSVSWAVCVVLYDPIKWILTGDYTDPDERGNIIIGKANDLIDHAKKLEDLTKPNGNGQTSSTRPVS